MKKYAIFLLYFVFMIILVIPIYTNNNIEKLSIITNKDELSAKFNKNITKWKISKLNTKAKLLNIPNFHIKYPKLKIVNYKYLQTKDNKLKIIFRKKIKIIKTNDIDVLVITANKNNYLARNKHLYKIYKGY